MLSTVSLRLQLQGPHKLSRLVAANRFLQEFVESAQLQHHEQQQFWESAQQQQLQIVRLAWGSITCVLSRRASWIAQRTSCI